jgi:hypothetical protein
MRITDESKIAWLKGYSGIGIVIEGDTLWIVQPVDGGNKDPTLYDSIEIESLETLEDLQIKINNFLKELKT